MVRVLRRAAAHTSVLMLLTGCGLGVLDMDFRSGNVRITALDVANAPVPGVSLALSLGNTAGMSSWTGVTNASGLATADALLNAEYVLTVTPPQGYALAAGQLSQVLVRVRSEETTAVTVRMQRTP